MTTSKSLPARPSLESLRKQAKKLGRDIAAGDPDAIARARAQLPHVDLPLTQRNAQLVLAREYGYAGWQDLTAEVNKRLGNRLEWAVTQARHAIHNNDLAAINEAFICACRFAHETVASLLLERSIALDPELGRHIDESPGRLAFIQYFIEKRPPDATALGPWKAFAMEQIRRAIHEG